MDSETPNQEVAFEKLGEEKKSSGDCDLKLELPDVDAVNKPYVPRKVSLTSRKLSQTSAEEVSRESKSKRSKWGSFASIKKTSQAINISSDSLKNWFPDFKLVTEPTCNVEMETNLHNVSTEEKTLTHNMSDTVDSIAEAEVSPMLIEEPETAEPKSEDVGSVSKIIFIQNLVRPFTLNQLKDLLKQSGNIVEKEFWIDKIKSKCFVTYETEKDALKARSTLNDMRWPPSNPKILKADFSNIEQLEFHRSGGSEAPLKQMSEQVSEVEKSRPVEGRKKRRSRDKPVREWDKDKIIQESPERAHSPNEEKPRSGQKRELKDFKKKSIEDTPAKLLDDLFQKTKKSPCIYWLPLTEEQAQKKEELRKMKKLEQEKRMDERDTEDLNRKNRIQRFNKRSREKEIRKSISRSCSPVPRKR